MSFGLVRIYFICKTFWKWVYYKNTKIHSQWKILKTWKIYCVFVSLDSKNRLKILHPSSENSPVLDCSPIFEFNYFDKNIKFVVIGVNNLENLNKRYKNLIRNELYSPNREERNLVVVKNRRKLLGLCLIHILSESLPFNYLVLSTICFWIYDRRSFPRISVSECFGFVQEVFPITLVVGHLIQTLQQIYFLVNWKMDSSCSIF